MGRKPVDQMRPDETRDAIWKAIRETAGKDGEPNRPFTVRSIWENLRCTRDTVREYLTGLEKAGYIQAVNTEIIEISFAEGPSVAKGTIYVLVRDCGTDAPRVRRDGTEVTQGIGRRNMWRTMRMLSKKGGDFTYRDIAFFASNDDHAVAEGEAMSYVQSLAEGGYLTVTAEPKAGHRKGTGNLTRYRLLDSKYTGPKAPQIQRVKQIWDPNTGKVVTLGRPHDDQ